MVSQSSYQVKLYVKCASTCKKLIGIFKILQFNCFEKLFTKSFFLQKWCWKWHEQKHLVYVTFYLLKNRSLRDSAK